MTRHENVRKSAREYDFSTSEEYQKNGKKQVTRALLISIKK